MSPCATRRTFAGSAPDATQKTFLPVAGATGLSAAKSAREGDYGFAWARAIWQDMLA
jgi:hypothetical protein